ncbi:TPM domain-containing protein [Azohydromonas caseinilytica]|uniref:TPM domain-containing protein n=1 Tax=Azohydromonas caseinilytica TaxID=2728836 RepID=A0A848F5Z4_9BURK|nr:TPM domain-containing protein [Azohydromonas caseinilytica]NML13783.1 TPM domain-containing protein [Azohydromonas caseinilytica]
MNRLLRLIRHRLFDEDDARRALGHAALRRIEARVRESEATHSGEIRVVVEAGLPLSYLWRGAAPRERAVAMFGKLRVWDTEANNGVLIYLLLAEHAIEIVADRGIDRHVGAAQWQHILQSMREQFRAGHFEDGLLAAVEAVDAQLRRHFPLQPGQLNPNELPDAPLRV